MSKEPFDHIEDRIREAAENSLPAFNEEAWTAMNKLLDKESERKARRRIIVFGLSSLVVLLIAISLYFSVTDNNTGKILQRNTSSKEVSVPTADKRSAISSFGETVTNKRPAVTKSTAGRLPAFAAKKHSNVIADTENLPLFIPVTDTGNVYADKKEPEIQQENALKETDILPDTLQDSLSVSAVTADTDVSKDSPPPRPAPKSDLKKQKKANSSHGLYIAGYGGADNNSTSILNNGITTVHAGIGVGYRLNDHISLQTGFFAGKKKYKAGAGDYYVKPGSYLSTVDITQINADCDVFEIPLAVRYDLLRRKNYFLYGMVSSSSYIMKKEYYDYHYIKNGTMTAAGWAYSGNRHLFSVVGITLGYEQKISERFSLLAEPYIKGPLSGIGEGKVKLYSAGLLLGAKFNLFK